jgi:hypothetical protein
VTDVLRGARRRKLADQQLRWLGTRLDGLRDESAVLRNGLHHHRAGHYRQVRRCMTRFAVYADF